MLRLTPRFGDPSTSLDDLPFLPSTSPSELSDRDLLRVGICKPPDVLLFLIDLPLDKASREDDRSRFIIASSDPLLLRDGAAERCWSTVLLLFVDLLISSSMSPLLLRFGGLDGRLLLVMDDGLVLNPSR